jgi:hypothetical protein
MVVERGLARCPRCVSVADYVFIETVSERTPQRAFGGLRYEVLCRKCGEHYGEDSQPLRQPLVAAAEPPITWPRDCAPVAPVDWRAEILGRCARATDRVHAELDVVVERTRAFALKHRFARKADGLDQTGG